MKKSIIMIAVTALVIIAGAAVLIFLTGTGGSGQSSVPEFIMPESTQQESSPPVSDTQSAPLPQTSAVPQQTTVQTAETPSAANEEHSSSATAEIPAVTTTAAPEPQETSASTRPATKATTSATQTTATDVPQEFTSETAENAETSEPQPEPVPENVLITSGDPLHYTRLEFTERRVRFSGVYSGEAVTEVIIHKPKITSSDLFCIGDSFRGSLDITSLTPGYYIIVVRLGSGAGMYYVFEKTEDGSRAVPSESLPAAANLAASESPLELPAQGVLQHITTQGKQRAAEILAEVKSLSDQICAGITNDYDKARALAQWVALNMYYDNDAAKNGVTDEELTLDFVLENHRSVCFGWTNLYSALCQAQGIECYNASGSVVTGSRCFLQTNSSDERAHSWNMVVIDGRKIWVDTVWNSSNNYENESYVTKAPDMQYFDIDNTLLAHDHRVTRFEHRDYFASIE